MKNWSKAIDLLKGCGAFNHPSGGVTIDNRVIRVVEKLLDDLNEKEEVNRKLSFGLRKVALHSMEVLSMSPTFVRDVCMRNANSTIETSLNTKDGRE